MSTLSKQSKTLWPLPGGAGNYLDSLYSILLMVERTTRTPDVISEMMDHFELISAKAATSYLRVPDSLGLVEIVGQSVYLTEVGQKYLTRPSRLVIRDALIKKIQGCKELLKILRNRPLRMGKLMEEMQKLGYTWTTNSQLRHRLRWLEEAGVVTRIGQGRPEYRLADAPVIN